MLNKLSPEVVARLTRLGARARLEQIEAERRAILATFPELSGRTPDRKRGRRPGRPRRTPPASRAAAAAPARAARKRTSHMSAAARKAASERMKQYWAKRRAAKTAEE